MQQQVQQILASNGTKTAKIIELFKLGYSRKQIADLQILGAYGAIQNVYAKYLSALGLNPSTIETFNPMVFNRKFGVEIEAFGIETDKIKRAMITKGLTVEAACRSARIHNAWKITQDGSVHGVNAFEIVSPILIGTDGLEQLQKVCKVLIELGAKINRSCGLHIHFDAQQFATAQWRNLLKNYATLENTIDTMMPQSRREDNNTYCKSIKIEGLNQKLDSCTTIAEIARTVFGGSRYFKVNTQSFSQHKTIEFRQHSGTIEFEKISNWVLFLHNLVDYSKAHVLADGNFEQIKKFNQTEIVNFFHNRINDLAA